LEVVVAGVIHEFTHQMIVDHLVNVCLVVSLLVESSDNGHAAECLSHMAANLLFSLRF